MAWSGTHIGWSYRYQNASNEQEIWFRLNDADGRLASPPLLVFDAPGDRPCCSDVEWAQGEFLVGLVSRTVNGYGAELAMRRLSASGTLLGPVIPVTAVPSPEIVSNIRVARTQSSLFASWYHWQPGNDIAIQGRWFDLDGNAQTTAQDYATANLDTEALSLYKSTSSPDRATLLFARSLPTVAIFDPMEQIQIAPDGSVLLGPQAIVEDLYPIGGYIPSQTPSGYGIGFTHRPSGNDAQIWLRRVSSDGLVASASFRATNRPPGTGLDGASVAYEERGYAIVWGDNREVPGEWDLFLETGPGYELLAVGAGPSPTAAPRIDLHQPDTPATAAVTSIAPYSAGGYGANAGAGDVDADTDDADEVLTGPGAGGVYGPQVRAFDWRANPIAKVNFFAYGTLKYGVKVQGALLDSDKPHEMLTAAGPGEVFGPHVRGWNHDGIGLTPIAKVNFFAYQTLKYGVNVGGGDVDGDTYAEILTGPGPGSIFGPHLRGFDFDGGAITTITKVNTFVFAASDFGLEVTSGDLDHDGLDEIAAAAGPGPSNDSRIAVYDYAASSGLSEVAGSRFEAFPGSLGGARLATCQWFDRDLQRELVVSRGPVAASSSEVAVFDDASTGFAQLPTFDPFPGQTHGVTLAPVFVGF